jgi:hypothetical protein
MSQVLIPEFGKTQSLLFQDLYFVTKKAPVRSTVKEATCNICRKGLEDGVSVTAKRIGLSLRLFCQYHLPEE